MRRLPDSCQSITISGTVHSGAQRFRPDVSESLETSEGYSHEIRSEAVDDGTERQTISKGRGHVLHVHVAVLLALQAAPLLQSLQGTHRCVMINKDDQ